MTRVNNSRQRHQVVPVTLPRPIPAKFLWKYRVHFDEQGRAVRIDRYHSRRWGWLWMWPFGPSGILTPNLARIVAEARYVGKVSR